MTGTRCNMEKVKVADPDLLALLNDNTAKEEEEATNRSLVTDPELLQILNEGKPTKQTATKDIKDVEPVEDVAELPEYAMEYTSPWEYAEGVMETIGGLARGAVSGVTGAAGDLESLARMVVADKDNQETVLPTSEDMRQNINYLIGEQKPNQLQKEGLDALEFMGNVLAPTAAVGKVVSKSSKFITDKIAKSETVKKALLDPVEKYASDLATVKLGTEGNVIKDKVGQKLVDLDVNPQTVSYVTNTEEANKKAMAEILKRTKKGAGNKQYQSLNPATEVLGKTVLDRLSALSVTRKNLGKRLKEVVDNELSNLSFPMEGLNQSFNMALKKSFDVEMGGLSKLPKATQNNLKELSGLLSAQTSTGNLSGKQLHSLKRILDDLRDVGAKDNMSRGVDNIIGTLRKDVNDKLGGASPAYRAVNEKLSKILGVEGRFASLDDTRKFLNGKELREKVGNKLKGLGNSSVGLNTQWQGALRELDDVLSEVGIKFKDDPVALSNFSVMANQFVNVNNAMLLKYGTKDMRRTALKAAAAGGIGNVFGAVTNVSDLVSRGIDAKDAKQALKAHNEAYAVMLDQLSK